jgi:hypothetical protein
MALAAPLNHWWHVPFYVTARGLTTSLVPSGEGGFDAEFDLLAHVLRIRTSGGGERTIELRPLAVADFYAEYLARMQSLGIGVHIDPAPAEFDDPTPYDQDRHHASYDREAVERFHQVLVRAERVLQVFRGRFLGKCSPVHFFWGSFDLAVTRFCGRRAELPPDADHVTREAYSHEVSSCGFWPGDRRYPQAAFYAYHSPAPAGLEAEPVRPGGWNGQLREFLLPYEEARSAAALEEAVLAFCQSAYEAGARRAAWDREALERRS